MNGYQTKNYTAHGGNETVIGGKLTFLSGSEVVGLDGAFAFPSAEAQSNSEATTIATLKEDFNALLAKLRAAGLMANEAGK